MVEQSNTRTVLLENMRHFFSTGATLEYEFRKKQLLQFKKAVSTYEKKIFQALMDDLGKSAEESYATEVGLVQAEITFALKNLSKWMKPERTKTNLLNLPSSSRLYRDPYGITLIIGAWNYPFQLLLTPVAGAMAAGNGIVLKPSEMAAATSAVIAEMIGEYFDPSYISVFEGDGQTVVPALMDSFRFDYIFYTGGVGVGKHIYQAAARDLIPITLELGGKSPAVVEKEADIRTSARRIALGKFLNSGQTCVAPDYVLVHEDVKEQLLGELIRSTKSFFGKDASQSYDYGKIINQKHFDSLLNLIPEKDKIIFGGQYDREKSYIGPTIVKDTRPGDALMQQEIFGPILPVIPYADKTDALDVIRRYDKPLSFYLFTQNKDNVKWWMKQVPFGGGCINNTLWHLSNPYLPFGGVGHSGIGAYHGKFSYETFSHAKGVLSSPTWFDPALKYPPLKGKLKLLRRFIR